jgi:hypothetical protein
MADNSNEAQYGLAIRLSAFFAHVCITPLLMLSPASLRRAVGDAALNTNNGIKFA